ncbi:tail fiber protein [Luteibacter sp. PPL201]|uniref:Tail fiber protein n=1 Tax=Luteibacter sahnii TaxID=3021977 RepID=A0ABT6B6T1_9GAMM|nr:tail fiber protein [Luteibacter sp. PPL193]MDY1548304.1 tail fiber protein [Luteibacter sp. PPL193]
MDPYFGEIRLFGFDYPTNGWALCNGQLLPIRQYSALYALLGVQFGGDGVNTFALPNYNGRAPMGQGTGSGLPPTVTGDTNGSETVALNTVQMPYHDHTVSAYLQADNRLTAPTTGASLASSMRASSFLGGSITPNTTFHPMTLSVAGNSLPHENRQPYLVLNYCIALEGVFPSFS